MSVKLGIFGVFFGIFAGNYQSMKRLLHFIIPLFVFFGCQKHSSKETWNMTYTTPAQIWEECFPLGNGHLGMMPDGGIDKETIVLNDFGVVAGNTTLVEGGQE